MPEIRIIFKKKYYLGNSNFDLNGIRIEINCSYKFTFEMVGIKIDRKFKSNLFLSINIFYD